MNKNNPEENIVFNVNAGNMNYANHGSIIHSHSINVSHDSTTFKRLIEDLHQHALVIDSISEDKRKEAIEILKLISEGHRSKKSRTRRVIQTLEEWQSVFGAASGIGSISSVILTYVRPLME
ncbi:hypothetical protein [Mechercharimyces sp. CAU 1602]|uniref:hypothetical protein n=1 Tax=Mechercharimyces sp. CAU 1602 TaxID=2973933 RepID=UPI0021611C3A|nr:hypothetical protein [Mechercharimyces sp. CAU 1602]MCS1350943.1 hypothetical protein [Mechercharimyces sp. CAU 1602]